MSESPPVPPCIVIGLVVATASAEAALDATSEFLLAMGARQLVPDGQAHTRAFLTRDTGVVLASSHADAADPRFVLIEIQITGEFPGASDRMPLSEELETESQRTRAFVARAFAVACERLAPLYAGLGVKWTLPLPSKLHTACLPFDLFHSARLDAADPPLAQDLGALLGAKQMTFAGGTLIAAGGLLDADEASLDQSIALGQAAAQRLARALAVLYP